VTHISEEPIILASASPRRKELLQRYRLSFHVVASDVSEEVDLALPPPEQALSLARRKGREVALRHPGLIIAAETLVVINGQVLGKPADAQEAEEMLKLLSGQEHQVYTGLYLYSSKEGKEVEGISRTSVWFKEISAAEISRYLQWQEYQDKAGSYAAQGMAAAFITKVDGCYHNVIGLPLQLLGDLLDNFGRRLV